MLNSLAVAIDKVHVPNFLLDVFDLSNDGASERLRSPPPRPAREDLQGFVVGRRR
jgi:hypothetical protein